MDRQDRIDRAVIALNGDPTAAPSYDGGVIRVVLVLRDGRYLWAAEESGAVKSSSEYEVICTYPEFMEARARLENKPIWDDAPAGADFLVQNSSGSWQFGRSNGAIVEPGQAGWRIKSVQNVDFFSPVASVGHVFGRWQDTLERSPSTNNEHHDHKEGEGVKWEPGVDLPLVDEVCEVREKGGTLWTEARVIAYHGSDVWLSSLGIKNSRNVEYRAIQTHRDKVIEAAEQHVPVNLAHGTKSIRVMFSDLYDAGMLDLPKGYPK